MCPSCWFFKGPTWGIYRGGCPIRRSSQSPYSTKIKRDVIDLEAVILLSFAQILARGSLQNIHIQFATSSDKALATSVASFTKVKDGAQKRSRTADLLITNQLLYQLSYLGIRPKDLADKSGACKDLTRQN